MTGEEASQSDRMIDSINLRRRDFANLLICCLV